MRKMIVIEGAGNRGKSSAIRTIRSVLLEKFPSARELAGKGFPIPETIGTNCNGDIRTIIELNGKKIGIESQGDPGSRQKQSLALFLREKCDYIICAARSRGYTVEDAKAVANSGGYLHIATMHYCVEDKTMQEGLNRLFAQHVLDLLETGVDPVF
jgi:hypothetical protein